MQQFSNPQSTALFKATSLYVQAEAKLKKNELKGAIIDFTEAIRLLPTYAEAYGYRGLAKYELGNKQGAITD